MNVYNCSSRTSGTLPSTIPNFTDWIIIRNSNINRLDTTGYFGRITLLDLISNKISVISNQFLEEMHESKSITKLDLRQNALNTLPQNMQKLYNLREIWLSGNPIHCECSMTWMIGWLNNFTTSTKNDTVVDFKELKCASGLMKGNHIYKLNDVAMGCFPSKWMVWQKITIGVAAAFSFTLVGVLTIYVIKKSRDLNFFFYYYCKWCVCISVPKDDPREDVSKVNYDAYLSYR